MVQKKRQVTRMLAVGDLADDHIRRLTRGETFTCCNGSETEHRHLSEFCLALQELLASMGQSLSDYSPEELRALLNSFTSEGKGA